jgi:thioredoxin:protein disulfide reductase
MKLLEVKIVAPLLLMLAGLLVLSGPVHAEQSVPFSKFGNIFGKSNESEFLEPEQAFKLSLSVQDSDTVLAEFVPAAGYYLYRHRISFDVDKTKGISVANTDLPAGELKIDAVFGETQVFHQPFSAIVNLKREANSPDRLTLKATYQGCSEKGICYPPINKTFDLTLAAASVAPELSASPPSKNAASPPPSDASIAKALAKSSSWLAIGVFFLAGLGLAFTPCVLPMIPILSGIIAGHGHTVTRTRGFILSLSYVLGMAIAYAIGGIIAGLTGSLLSTMMQNPWVLGGFALIFVMLALSMFGLYELRMPTLIQSGADSLAHKLSGGKIAAVFGMGALSALIVSPCVAAPLAGALLYISQTRDVVLGGTALFALALGMGMPLLAIGLSAGALLPRAGAWMDAIKRFFGILLLAVAIWIISPLIPAVVQMLLWATLLIILASFLRAIDPLPSEAGGLPRFAKGLGLIALVSGIAMLVGVFSGSRNPLQPLGALRSGAPPLSDEVSSDVDFEPVLTLNELDGRLEQTDRPVMLVFYADWCVECKKMEQLTFRDIRVSERLQDMLLLHVDVTENTTEDQALLKRFGLFGPPGVIFFSAEGREIDGLRVIGYQAAETFLQTVEQVLDPIAPSIKSTVTFIQRPIQLATSK